jgi:4-nitrophenyl phosphatase
MNLASLRDVRAVLFDMDGVIYVGERLLPGVQDMFDYLEASGRQWLCVTNNASKTPVQFVEKLTGMGVRSQPHQILGSAEATAGWLREQVDQHGWANGPVIVMGQEGLRTALTVRGFELTDDPHAATYAVAGINFKLTYEDLARVALAIRAGAKFIGTNSDPSYPTERGQLPGAGSILALLATATGVQPQVVGKPNRGMFDQALRRLGVQPQQAMMVGDRYDTDICGAVPLGLLTAGVLTGVTTLPEWQAADPKPTVVVPGLPELLQLFRTADAGG